VVRKYNVAQPAAGSSFLAWLAPIWRQQMMQNLDLLDLFLLAGSVVYFACA
jgi:hypothetical protein